MIFFLSLLNKHIRKFSRTREDQKTICGGRAKLDDNLGAWRRTDARQAVDRFSPSARIGNSGMLINATLGGGSQIVVNGRMSLISLMLIGYLECSYLLNMRILLFRSGGQIA
jgi:hypothetical protein